MADKALTEMEQFAIDALKKEAREVSASYLGKLWREHKHGRAFASSRDMFGSTSAAYKTLRRLETRGLVKLADKKYETYKTL